jgi:hypothetical protein
MEIDKSLDYKIQLTPVESFVGSLNRKEIDEDTQTNKFIDDIINEQSKYINMFSNVNYFDNSKPSIYNKTSTYLISNQCATSLGFYTKDCDKIISLKNSINNAIDKIFDNNIDINYRELDLVVDAGVSTIAQFITSVYPKTKKGEYDFTNDNSYLFRLDNQDDITSWKLVIEKYN